MKLLVKYSRINAFTAIIIFLLSGIAFYFLLRYVLVNQLDHDLSIEEDEIMIHTKQSGTLPQIIPLKDQLIHFEAVTQTGKRQFNTVSILDSTENENEPYRQLVFYITADNRYYKAIVLKSMEATDNITRSIILITVITILVMLAAGFIVNRFILKKLWSPFYESIRKIKEHRLGKSAPVFETTGIDEFNILNDTLSHSLRHAEKEFNTLKEFTENASHEMQTPLAVIRAKLDVLIQDEQLSQHQSEMIQGAYNAVQRLARLNQSMLLLSKIENNGFAETEQINFQQLTEEKISYFKELLENKGLRIFSTVRHASVSMNPALADVLLNNLFSNAVKHTAAGGHITIDLSAGHFTIANSNAEKPLNARKIFTRFYKGGVHSDEHGLGLAIVQQICTVSGFKIGYSFENNEHRFAVFF